jgi:NADH-ubiquinone oxidoreductase chain 5
MYLTLIILPLLASIISGFLGRKIGIYGSQIITCVSIFFTAILAVIIFFEVGFNNISVSIKLFR